MQKLRYPKLFLSFVILLIAFAVWRSIRKKQKAKEEYHIFYNTSFQGRLTSISSSLGTTYISINGSRKYHFNPYTSIEENKIFGHVAEPNDSIVKNSASDTLLLFKNNKVYKFTFAKLE